MNVGEMSDAQKVELLSKRVNDVMIRAEEFARLGAPTLASVFIQYARSMERMFTRRLEEAQRPHRFSTSTIDYKFRQRLDTDNAYLYFQTRLVWTEDGWRCSFCGAETKSKYIATGHDHTDYHYDTCNCDGASVLGKRWHELK